MGKTDYKSIRLFKSDFWEFFSHINPITPLIFWTPVCVFLLTKSQEVYGPSLLENGGVALIALLVWSLTEYTMHRLLFHYEANGPTGKRLIYLFHGIHHDDPQDPTRLVFPILPAVLIMIVIFSFFKMVVPERYLFSFTAYFLIGYLCYDYIHYATHHWPMKGPVGKFLRTYHLKHHHGEKGLRYGVSNPLWDLVFGTYLSPYSKQQKDERQVILEK